MKNPWVLEMKNARVLYFTEIFLSRILAKVGSRLIASIHQVLKHCHFLGCTGKRASERFRKCSLSSICMASNFSSLCGKGRAFVFGISKQSDSSRMECFEIIE